MTDLQKINSKYSMMGNKFKGGSIRRLSRKLELITGLGVTTSGVEIVDKEKEKS